MRGLNIQSQAQKELDSNVGKNRLVIESDLSQLPFLQAIIKENFCLHHSTPHSLPRTAQDHSEINGYLIPKGSIFLVNVWAIARDSDFWSNPLEFNPELFLKVGERSNVDVRGNDFELIKFGVG